MPAGRLSDEELAKIEERSCSGDSMAHRDSLHLVMRLRDAYREIDDPNYSYVGRIPRGAILCRDAQIDALQKRVDGLNKLEAIVRKILSRKADDVRWRDIYNAEVAALVGVEFDPQLPSSEGFIERN